MIMWEMLKKKLTALACDGWELKETVKNGWEFYFIRHELDQNRTVEIRTLEVTVYKALEDGKFLGSASGEIPPTASEEEADRILSGLLFQAGLMKNPFYTLNSRPVSLPAQEAMNPEKTAEDFLTAMSEVRETPEADVNSYEIFSSVLTLHFLNSEGVEYTWSRPVSMIEVVVNARKDGHEIELYRSFDSGTCDRESLKRDVEAALLTGHDRLRAEPTPQLKDIPVLFSTDAAVNIYEYFLDRAGAVFKYRQLSPWEPGKPVADDLRGDRISLEALAQLPNSSRNLPADDEGALIEDRFLIRDGLLEQFWGNRQYSRYLGLENSSKVYNYRVSGGGRTEDELRQGDYLELVEFSDFQVDPVGGDIAGEIRLGYLHENGQVKIITGGSVSGSMTEAVRDMEMSREQVCYDTAMIPKVTKLRGLLITGVAGQK